MVTERLKVQISVGLWAGAAAIGLLDVVKLFHTWWLGSDFQPTVLSVAALFHHHAINAAYAYPPGLLLIAFPLLLVQHGRVAEDGMLLLEILGIAFSLFGLSRITRTRLLSPVFGLLALALSVSGSVFFVLELENLTIFLLPFAVGFYWLLLSRQWMLSGLVLGLSLTIKPMLAPLLLLLLLERQWRATAVAVAIPVLTSAIALGMSAHPQAFLNATLRVLSGNKTATGNIDLSGIGSLWSINGAVVVTLQVLVVVLAIGVVVRAWTSSIRRATRYLLVGETGIACLLLTFTFAHTFYGLLALPILALGLHGRRDGFLVATMLLIPAQIVGVFQWPGTKASSTLLCLALIAVIVLSGAHASHSGRSEQVAHIPAT
jgi:hypothetical protein